MRYILCLYWPSVGAYWLQCGCLLAPVWMPIWAPVWIPIRGAHVTCAPKVAQQIAAPSCMNRSNLPPEYAYTCTCIYMCLIHPHATYHHALQ
jgi:hypothetical protein